MRIPLDVSLRAFFLLCIVLTVRVASALAGAEQLSHAEFSALATDLAPKVNLFRDVWEKDPAAEFYGGTTRDFLYWIKGQFRPAHSKPEAERIAAELRAMPMIDVRSFIIGDSDVDIFTSHAHSFKPESYGVRKFDYQNFSVFDPQTELGFNELHQGYLPAEKIRLGRNGFVPGSTFGSGVREIQTGPITVHFAAPDEFRQTKYAKEGLNHPVLLALRYLRVQAIDYFQSYGQGVPDVAALKAIQDPESARAARAVIAASLEHQELTPFLKAPQFKSWVNGSMQKSFRSYTNPTAARELYREFRADQLPIVYAGDVEPISQYLFAQYRDEPRIRQALVAAGIDEREFYRPVHEEFPDGYLYHGTRSEPAFRSILFQGVAPSSGGSAGEGLYGVRATSRKFAETWGGDPDLLLRFPVRPGARIVDIRGGAGAQAWQAFQQSAAGKKDLEAFSQTYGIDIIRYPYDAEAYVVKNIDALGRAEGVNRVLLSLPELLARVHPGSDPLEVLRMASDNRLNDEEWRLVRAKLEPGVFRRFTQDLSLLVSAQTQLTPEAFSRLTHEIHRDYPTELQSLVKGALMAGESKALSVVDVAIELLRRGASFGDDLPTLIALVGNSEPKKSMSLLWAIDAGKSAEVLSPTTFRKLLSWAMEGKGDRGRLAFTALSNAFKNNPRNVFDHATVWNELLPKVKDAVGKAVVATPKRGAAGAVREMSLLGELFRAHYPLAELLYLQINLEPVYRDYFLWHWNGTSFIVPRSPEAFAYIRQALASKDASIKHRAECLLGGIRHLDPDFVLPPASLVPVAPLPKVMVKSSCAGRLATLLGK